MTTPIDVTFLLPFMIFCHIVDDYYLQGILAQMKQRSWWETNAPDWLYRNDYKVALIVHGISWAFMVMLPIAIYSSFAIPAWFLPIMIFNGLFHAFVDDMKANKFCINLAQDQLIHLAQILFTWALAIFTI